MNAPSWLFFALVFWVLATVWCNSLEPAVAELVPENVATTIQGEGGLRDPSLTTPTGATRAWSWAKNIWRALTFDYAIFDNDNIVMQILRILCIIFTVASLWFIGELIIMVWRVFHAVRGSF